MKPSEQCKAAGLSGVVELQEITGINRQTLYDWHRDRQKLFKVIVAGAAEIKKQSDGEV